jgi:hypothetical protein
MTPPPEHDQHPNHNRDLPDERWRPIAGFETSYEVSDAGRVRSLARTITRGYRARTGLRQPVPARVLRPSQNTSGTLKVTLCRPGHGGPLTRAIHLLVLTAFIGPRPPGHTGRHLNRDRTDNHLANLAWRPPPLPLPHRQRAPRPARPPRPPRPRRRKPDCIRGHPLCEPNLVPSALQQGHRSCLACMRAYQGRYLAANRGRAYDLQTESDKHYQLITKNHSQQTQRSTQP